MAGFSSGALRVMAECTRSGISRERQHCAQPAVAQQIGISERIWYRLKTLDIHLDKMVRSGRVPEIGTRLSVAGRFFISAQRGVYSSLAHRVEFLLPSPRLQLAPGKESLHPLPGTARAR